MGGWHTSTRTQNDSERGWMVCFEKFSISPSLTLTHSHTSVPRSLNKRKREKGADKGHLRVCPAIGHDDGLLSSSLEADSCTDSVCRSQAFSKSTCLYPSNLTSSFFVSIFCFVGTKKGQNPSGEVSAADFVPSLLSSLFPEFSAFFVSSSSLRR